MPGSHTCSLSTVLRPLGFLCLQVAGLPMLAPFAQRMEQLIEQLAACLEALAAMVRKQASPDE